MNLNEAQQIATRITDIWPRGGIATHVVEEILQSDYGDPERARRAVEKMKRSVTFFNLVEFHAYYVAAPGAIQLGEPHVCGDCNNDGWQNAPEFERNGIMYTAMKPCSHCKHGRRAEHSTIWKETQARTAELNDQTTTTEGAA